NQSWQARDDGTVVLEDASFDLLRGRFETRQVILDRKGTREFTASVRAYTLAELKEMLDSVGLSLHRVLGGLDLSPYTARSRRMVLYAVKGLEPEGIVGFPSVGKSTLLNQITDADSAVAAYDFTTLDVIPGLLEHRGAKIQILDMPGLIRGASKGRGRGKEVLSVARACDLILLMIDVFETHVDVLADELHLAGIRLNERPADVTLTKANRGGLTVNPTVKLTKLDAEMVADICREWGYLNGTVVVRQDITEDQLIDVLAGNRVVLRPFVAS